MVEKILIDKHDEGVINIPDKLDKNLSPELRKRELIEAVIHLPLVSILYATSVFFDEERNRKGARELSKSGLLRALGIIFNSQKLYGESLVHYKEAVSYLNIV